MPSYNFKCQNPKCGCEFLRHFKVEEFEKTQYGTGWGCFNCGWPRMAVIKSNRNAKDGFQPGFQRNIMKHCETYGEYKAWLKKLGLIELGYEELPPEPKRKSIWTDKLLKKAYDLGFNLDDNKMQALKDGLI